MQEDSHCTCRNILFDNEQVILRNINGDRDQTLNTKSFWIMQSTLRELIKLWPLDFNWMLRTKWWDEINIKKYTNLSSKLTPWIWKRIVFLETQFLERVIIQILESSILTTDINTKFVRLISQRISMLKAEGAPLQIILSFLARSRGP